MINDSIYTWPGKVLVRIKVGPKHLRLRYSVCGRGWSIEGNQHYWAVRMGRLSLAFEQIW